MTTEKIDFHGITMTVVYDYYPAEAETRDEPGCDAECIVEKVIIGGQDCSFFFDSFHNESNMLELQNHLIGKMIAPYSDERQNVIDRGLKGVRA